MRGDAADDAADAFVERVAHRGIEGAQRSASSTTSAITLLRYPPAIVPIVTTTLSSGSVSRATTFCSAKISAADAGIASTAVCG